MWLCRQMLARSPTTAADPQQYNTTKGVTVIRCLSCRPCFQAIQKLAVFQCNFAPIPRMIHSANRTPPSSYLEFQVFDTAMIAGIKSFAGRQRLLPFGLHCARRWCSPPPTTEGDSKDHFCKVLSQLYVSLFKSWNWIVLCAVASIL